MIGGQQSPILCGFTQGFDSLIMISYIYSAKNLALSIEVGSTKGGDPTPKVSPNLSIDYNKWIIKIINHLTLR